MDVPWEWFYDKETRKLSFVLPSGSCSDISPTAIRGRIVDYGIEIENTSNLKMKNIEFFASTVKAEGKDNSNDINQIHLDSLKFLYPATSHRMLKKDSMPKTTTLMSFAGGDIIVENCEFVGADTAALQYRGNGITIKNNEFKYNDWSGVSGDAGGMKATLQGRCKSKKHSFKGEKIVHNTFLYGGATIAIAPCVNATVSENLVVGSRHGNLKKDGAAINMGVSTNLKQHFCKNSYFE